MSASASNGGAQEQRAPRSRLRRVDRARQLLAVAEEVFAERGVEVTMDEIAERAGVTKPVLYHHFPSKDALVVACVRAAREELFRVTSAAAADATSLEHVLWLTLRTFFGFVSDKTKAWSVLAAQGALRSVEANDEIRQMRRSQSEVTAKLLAAVFPDLDPRRARLHIEAIDGASERTAIWLRTQVEPDLDEVTDELFSALWLGGRALKAGERWDRTWTYSPPRGE